MPFRLRRIKRKWPLFLLPAILVFTATTSFLVSQASQTQSVFGPESFTRTAGATDVYTRLFAVPADGIGPYTLHIDNGRPDGKNRISSGTVSINGIKIVHPSDFNQNVAMIDRSVDLAATNTLTVTLNSKPGGFITVTVLGMSVEPPPNLPPAANAGPDKTVSIGTRVQLNGRDSFDPDGGLITYAWSMIEKPPGSLAEFSDPTSVQPHFTADHEGIYRIQLIVNDGLADSPPDEVVITAHRPNTPPTANAGPDQNVLTGSIVLLNGTGSTDPEVDPLTYQWAIAQAPAGSAAGLSDPSSPTPSFMADLDGEYRIRLIVNDGEFDSALDEMIVTAATPNRAPTADAGADQAVSKGTPVRLDGSGSFDPDGDPLTYSWTFVSIPAGSGSALDDPALAAPSFMADRGGEYVFHLTVSDGELTSAADAVVVVSVNHSPIANAGADQTVIIGTRVILDGSGSADPDGDGLTFNWNVIARPIGSGAILTAPTSTNPNLTPDLAGFYTLQLIVNDDEADSQPDEMQITAENPAPFLESLSPNLTLAGSGEFLLTLTGGDFVPTASVNFGGAVLSPVLVTGAQLQATVPAEAVAMAGIIPVTVTHPSPGGGISEALSFEIRNPVPVILSLSPDHARAGDADLTLTITGTAFVPGAVVEFDGTALSTTDINNTQLTAVIPASLMATVGSDPVTVVNPPPGGGPSLGLPFTVEAGAPLISASPNQVPQGSYHRMIQLTGASIHPGASVQIGGTGLTVHQATRSVTYSATDSRSGGPAFSWVDATDGAMALAPCDDCASDAFPIGFPFTVFGQDVETFFVNSNGLVTFEEATEEYNNSLIPDADPPDLYLAPFWDDLYQGPVYVKTVGEAPNRILVVQWDHISTCCSTDNSDLTFEVLLDEATQGIRFQYLSLSGAVFDGSEATVGIEGPRGDEGTAYLVDGAPVENLLADGLAVAFTPIVTVLTLEVSVAEDAPLGPRDLILTDPDGTQTTAPGVFSVVPSPIELLITSPAPGSLLQEATVMVQGTVSSENGEVGVAVNGVIAQVNGDRFAANDVPLTLGENSLIAVATDFEGNNLSRAVTVTTQALQNPVVLLANPESGTAPLAVKFSVLTNLTANITGFALDADGDGTADFNSLTLPDSETFTYTQPGLYDATVAITDDQGMIYTDTLAVNVLSLPELDALLKTIWVKMRDALRQGDVETAITYFTFGSQEKYSRIFGAIGDNLVDEATHLPDIALVTIYGTTGKYRIQRDVNMNGQVQTLTYWVYLIQDTDGIWRIKQF